MGRASAATNGDNTGDTYPEAGRFRGNGPVDGQIMTHDSALAAADVSVESGAASDAVPRAPLPETALAGRPQPSSVLRLTGNAAQGWTWPSGALRHGTGYASVWVYAPAGTSGDTTAGCRLLLAMHTSGYHDGYSCDGHDLGSDRGQWVQVQNHMWWGSKASVYVRMHGCAAGCDFYWLHATIERPPSGEVDPAAAICNLDKKTESSGAVVLRGSCNVAVVSGKVPLALMLRQGDALFVLPMAAENSTESPQQAGYPGIGRHGVWLDPPYFISGWGVKRSTSQPACGGQNQGVYSPGAAWLETGGLQFVQPCPAGTTLPSASPAWQAEVWLVYPWGAIFGAVVDTGTTAGLFPDFPNAAFVNPQSGTEIRAGGAPVCSGQDLEQCADDSALHTGGPFDPPQFECTYNPLGICKAINAAIRMLLAPLQAIWEAIGNIDLGSVSFPSLSDLVDGIGSVATSVLSGLAAAMRDAFVPSATWWHGVRDDLGSTTAAAWVDKITDLASGLNPVRSASCSPRIIGGLRLPSPLHCVDEIDMDPDLGGIRYVVLGFSGVCMVISTLLGLVGRLPWEHGVPGS